jgi:hypothetical protein
MLDILIYSSTAYDNVSCLFGIIMEVGIEEMSTLNQIPLLFGNPNLQASP